MKMNPINLLLTAALMAPAPRDLRSTLTEIGSISDVCGVRNVGYLGNGNQMITSTVYTPEDVILAEVTDIKPGVLGDTVIVPGKAIAFWGDNGLEIYRMQEAKKASKSHRLFMKYNGTDYALTRIKENMALPIYQKTLKTLKQICE